MLPLMHLHLTFSGLVGILSLTVAAGARSFPDPFEGTEIKCHDKSNIVVDVCQTFGYGDTGTWEGAEYFFVRSRSLW